MIRIVSPKLLPLFSGSRRGFGSHIQGLSFEQAQTFQRDGVLVLEDFYSKEQCEGLRAECSRLLKTYDQGKDATTIFSTVKQEGNEYFLSSSDKIRFFFEEYAFDTNGKLTVPLDKALNKIGHALHALNPVFNAFTTDPRALKVARSLFSKPVVPQSMYIFKQPGFGGEVVPHQDSSFLYTRPLSVIGFWVALQDCTLENGCLWAIKGSHQHGIDNNRRMIQVAAEGGKERSIKFTADPKSYEDKDFVPLFTRAGSLVLLHGQMVHRSLANNSKQSRHSYVWHVVEGSAYYDHLNWLQPSLSLPFYPL